MDKLAVSVAEAAALVGIGRTKGFELCAKREWPTVRVGRRTLVPMDGLRKWLERQGEQTGSAP